MPHLRVVKWNWIKVWSSKGQYFFLVEIFSNQFDCIQCTICFVCLDCNLICPREFTVKHCTYTFLWSSDFIKILDIAISTWGVTFWCIKQISIFDSSTLRPESLNHFTINFSLYSMELMHSIFLGQSKAVICKVCKFWNVVKRCNKNCGKNWARNGTLNCSWIYFNEILAEIWCLHIVLMWTVFFSSYFVHI